MTKQPKTSNIHPTITTPHKENVNPFPTTTLQSTVKSTKRERQNSQNYSQRAIADQIVKTISIEISTLDQIQIEVFSQT